MVILAILQSKDDSLTVVSLLGINLLYRHIEEQAIIYLCRYYREFLEKYMTLKRRVASVFHMFFIHAMEIGIK